jgi:hypothetical protein
MWGFKNYLNRPFSNLLFELITNQSISTGYNSTLQSPKGGDQFILADRVYNLINREWIIYDSFLCNSYAGSMPWSSKRQGNCFLGLTTDCEPDINNFYNCSITCRPKDHQDWFSC